MGNNVSMRRIQTFNKIRHALTSAGFSAQSPSRHHSGAFFDDYVDLDVFISCLTYIFLPKDPARLREHRYEVWFSYQELDQMTYVTFAAIRTLNGSVDAKIQSSKGGANTVAAFKAWKEHVRRKLEDISVSMPEQVMKPHVEERQAPPRYKAFE